MLQFILVPFSYLVNNLCFCLSVCETVAAGREGERGCAPGGTVQGAVFAGVKYGILKFGRFWRIGLCIADSDILTPPS